MGCPDTGDINFGLGFTTVSGDSENLQPGSAWVEAKNISRGQTPSGVGVKKITRGLTPAGGGVRNIWRGIAPAGVRVKIFWSGSNPAGGRDKIFSRGKALAGVGVKNFCRGPSPAGVDPGPRTTLIKVPSLARSLPKPLKVPT